MHNLEDRRVVVTGGSRGLGLGIVEALAARKAKLTVVARDRGRLAEVERTLGVSTIAGDATDPKLAASVLREVSPSVVILSAGAKRMQWLLASYANGVSAELDRGIRFQAILPRQIIGDTELGRVAAAGYARQKNITVEQFLATFGKPLSPRQVGEHVATILSDAAHDATTAFELRGETGIRSLDG